MRILLIGGAGQLGTHTSAHLVTRHEVRVLDRGPATVEGVESIVGDCCDDATVRDAVNGMDAVVHLAAAIPQHPDDNDPAETAAAFAVNVASVHLALVAAQRSGCTAFVHVSTLSVFRHYAHVPVEAGAAPDAVRTYGLTKRLGEQVCAALAGEASTAVTSLRLAHPTPDDDWPLWRLPIPGDVPRPATMDDGTVLPALAASDAARAFEAAIAYRGPYRTFAITGGEEGVALLHSDTHDTLRWSPIRTQ